MNRFNRNNGFTLIELMITITVVGILAAIAYPSYTQFAAKGARADALSGLMNLANRQEQFYLDHKTFTKNMKQLGMDDDPYIVDNGFYEVDAFSIGDGSKYTLKATAIGTQATRDTACPVIQITSDGVKTPTECWGN
ncbi:prepilin-type N-terminal cleavage/methylation domain-containing protein [Shewanella sp. 10N.286.52.C2]|uniref:type IV pilin protein n=1 Tax=Shewanella sp. 10N.286.52.C2 TaxID=1880838 RepID=UPI000C831A1B|nr:type IV pilin protein [Shewanella sp. 10N.286.52.C2]PMG31454.1 prepilin-type N-terminal cleavage/methylation domain-containing protein [Shewanella sp. 10N.286.52.C2]